jgi:hypothetical protein
MSVEASEKNFFMDRIFIRLDGSKESPQVTYEKDDL